MRNEWCKPWIVLLLAALVLRPNAGWSQGESQIAELDESDWVARPERPAYPPRPRVAMIAVSPTLPRSQRLSAERLADWFEAAGAMVTRGEPYDWVDRSHLDRALDEMAWAVAGGEAGGVSRSGSAALALGRWAGCDLLLVGELRPDRRPGAAADALGLYLAVVDPTTATRVVTRDKPLPLPADGPGSTEVVELASIVKQMLREADAQMRAAADQPVVMLLHFRNISRNDRLDRLNRAVPERLRALAEADGRLRLVQVDEPNRALNEQEMLLTGLLEADPEAWASAADAYLWGTAEEIAGEKPGGDRADVPAGRDPQLTPVRVRLHYWNSRDAPEVFETITATRDVDAALETLARQAWAAAGRPLPDTISPQARRRVARLIMSSDFRSPPTVEFRYDDPVEGWRGRQFFYWLHAARAARFLDPRNPKRAHAAVVAGRPELADDPWAALEAHAADIDQAIRQALHTKPVDPAEMSAEELDESLDDGFMMGDAFLDLVERRLEILRMRSAMIDDLPTGYDINHRNTFLHYISPHLDTRRMLSEAERQQWRTALMGDLAQLGQEWSRWTRAVSEASGPEKQTAQGMDLERAAETAFVTVSRLLHDRRDEPRSRVVRAIDAWLPLLETQTRLEREQSIKHTIEGMAPPTPEELWPELSALAEAVGHRKLRTLLRTNPGKEVPATATKTPADDPTAETADGWTPMQVSRSGGTGDSVSEPERIDRTIQRRQDPWRVLEIRTRDVDGGRTTYRWRQSTDKPTRDGGERDPGALGEKAETIPATFNAQATRAWLANQRAAGRLQGGILEKTTRSASIPRRDPFASGPARGPGGLTGWPVHWTEQFASLPPDMPAALRALVEAEATQLRERAEIRGPQRDRRHPAFGRHQPAAQEPVQGHAQVPVFNAHSLRVQMAGAKNLWPAFWPEPERPTFGPARWVDGWLVSSVSPTRGENLRGRDAGRGNAGHRDLRWLHPVSLADRHPGVEWPEGAVVRDVADGQTPGRVWVATFGNGLQRIDLRGDPERMRHAVFSTQHGLVDQRLSQVVRVGDRLLAIASGGASIVSDLAADRPTFRDAEIQGLNVYLPATVLGRFACFPGPGGGWFDPATGELVLLSAWLDEHLPGSGQVRGGFVGDGATWLLVDDGLVRVAANLKSHRRWPLPVPPHSGMVGHAAGGQVWLAYPDLGVEIAQARNVVGHDSRPYEPKILIEVPVQPAGTGASRLLLFNPERGQVVGQVEVEGRVQQLASDGRDLFVIAPSGAWEVSIYPQHALLAAMGAAELRPAVGDTADAGRGDAEVSPLIRAAIAGNDAQVKAALSGDGNLDESDPLTGVTPLLAAARYGHASVVKQLLDAGADPQQKCALTPWMRPLMVAAMRDDAEVFTALIAADALTSKHNQRLGTEAHAAVLHRSYAVLEQLPRSRDLDRAARCALFRPTPANGHLTLKMNYFRPLDLAVYRGDARAVELLLKADHRACWTRADVEYISTLAHAATLDRGDLLRLLLADREWHSHVDHGDSNGASVWDYVASFNRPAALSAMLDARVELPAEPDLLLVAARAGSLADLQRLADAGLPIDHVWTFRRETQAAGRQSVGSRAIHLTVLTTAVANGHHALIDPMVRAFGLDLDADLAGDRQHDVLLRMMLERGDYDAAIARVEVGADVDGASRAVSTATLLSQVAERGGLVEAELLLRLGANPRAVGRDGRNAVQMAKTSEMKQLLESVPRRR